MSMEMKSFLQLLYSLAKQYIAWYEKEIKQVANAPRKIYNESIAIKD